MSDNAQSVTTLPRKRWTYWLKVVLNVVIVQLILGIVDALTSLHLSGHVALWVEGVLGLLIAPILAFAVVGYIAEDQESLWCVIAIMGVLNLYGRFFVPCYGHYYIFSTIVSWILTMGILSLEMLAGRAIASWIPKRKKV